MKKLIIVAVAMLILAIPLTSIAGTFEIRSVELEKADEKAYKLMIKKSGIDLDHANITIFVRDNMALSRATGEPVSTVRTTILTGGRVFKGEVSMFKNMLSEAIKRSIEEALSSYKAFREEG